MSERTNTVRLTHGRHCKCSACARQDWAEPGLAPCGMHGPDCPPVYAPYDLPLGTEVDENGNAIKRDFTVRFLDDRTSTISCRPSWLQERLRAQPPERFLFIDGDNGEVAINLDNVFTITPYVEEPF